MSDAAHLIGNAIAESAQMSVGYIQKLAAGVTADQFGRLAPCGNSLIQSNHPAFIMGHLSLYPCRIVEDLGSDASAIAPTTQYETLFSPSATCQDDADGTLYPSMEEITERFVAAHKLAIEMLKSTEDSKFAAVNPNESMRARFGTLASMHAFYLGGHVMIHAGQLSAWRRMMGLGAV